MSAQELPQVLLPGVRINREGEWFHEGDRITHPRILAYLQKNLQRDDHGYFVQGGRFRLPVIVEETPFTVVGVERTGEEILLTLNDQTREALDPLTLRLSAGEVPYCTVKVGRFEARLTHAAAYQLLELVEYDEGTAGATLVLGTERYPVERAG